MPDNQRLDQKTAATAEQLAAGLMLITLPDGTMLKATAEAVKAFVAISLALTGVPTAPTPATSTNTDQIATAAFVQAVMAAMIDSSPAALNTLNELAAALNDDPNFAATVATNIGNKVDKTDVLNALTETASGKVLDARQGKILDDLITALANTVENKADLTAVYTRQTVANYVAAVTAATGIQWKIITVTTDETAGSNETEYLYKGSTGVLFPLAIKAVSAEINTGTDDDKFITSLSLEGSKYNTGVINVKAYGATGDGVTDDRSAIAAAIAAAANAAPASGKRVVYFPPGVYLVTFADASGQRNFALTQSIELVGAGQHQTKLQFGPETPTFMYDGFAFPATGGIHVHCRDIELAGPADPGALGNANQSTTPFHIFDNTTEASLRLTRVRITGEWVWGLLVDQGSGIALLRVIYDDCDVTSYAGNVGFFGPDNADRRLECHNTTFRKSGIPSGAPGYPFGHSIYIHPQLSFSFTNCNWVGVHSRYIIHHYSSGGKAGVPKFSRLINCMVKLTGTSDGIISDSNVGATLEIIGGEIDCKISLTQNLALNGGTHKIGVTNTSVGTIGSVTVTGALLREGSKIYPNGALKPFVLSNCIFDSDTDIPIEAFIGPLSANDIIIINGGVIKGRSGSNNAVAAIILNIGKVIMNDVHISGRFGHFGQGALSWYHFSGEGVLETNRCTYDVSNGDAIQVVGTTIAAGKLYGEGNIFPGAGKVNLAAGSVGHLMNKRRMKTVAVASATTLSLELWDYDTFHISGTTAIDNINISDGAAAQRAFAGQIKLIFDSTASTSTAGNIKPKSTAARTANEMAIFQYDPVAGFWYEG